MVRRAPAAAVGVIAGLALISAPAAAMSGPVTRIMVSLDAVQGGSVWSKEVAVTAT
ncbi:MAG TPA: hypothetical protein VGJ99_07420 [Actinomycetota bacterium]|jgi:hypothetical protein